MRVAVHLSRVAATALGVRAEARSLPGCEGTPAEAAAYLREHVPVGTSVEVRRYRDDGTFAGLRSCMCKPSLWADVWQWGTWEWADG